MATHALLILTTFGSAADARAFAQGLVDARQGASPYLSWLKAEVGA